MAPRNRLGLVTLHICLDRLHKPGNIVLAGINGRGPFSMTQCGQRLAGDGADAGAFHAGDDLPLIGREDIPQVLGRCWRQVKVISRGQEFLVQSLGDFWRQRGGLDGFVNGDVFNKSPKP